MTPLAQAILNDDLGPRRLRYNGSGFDRLPLGVRASHAFELTAVYEMIRPLALKMLSGWDEVLRLQETLYMFLPAPSTWIEYRVEETHQRIGWLLEEQTDLQKRFGGPFALMTICVGGAGYLEVVGETIVPLRGNDRIGEVRSNSPLAPWVTKEEMQFLHLDIYPMLAMINTPRIIGRKQHMPHAGLQRKLARELGMVGKFPLHAWTEIKLEVRPPVIDNSTPHESHLTGGKALHFCRSYLRVRLGQLEVVSAHWRGDPSLGIKQTRYALVPPKSRAVQEAAPYA